MNVIWQSKYFVNNYKSMRSSTLWYSLLQDSAATTKCLGVVACDRQVYTKCFWSWFITHYQDFMSLVTSDLSLFSGTFYGFHHVPCKKQIWSMILLIFCNSEIMSVFTKGLILGCFDDHSWSPWNAGNLQFSVFKFGQKNCPGVRKLK